MEYLFGILLKNNKTYNKLILGKELENEFEVYTLNVSRKVDLKYYYKLLKEESFSKSDFKIVTQENLENYLTKNKDMIISSIVSNKNIKIAKFLEKLLTYSE